eukprot:3944600-Prymnesium_polylepis.1
MRCVSACSRRVRGDVHASCGLRSSAMLVCTRDHDNVCAKTGHVRRATTEGRVRQRVQRGRVCVSRCICMSWRAFKSVGANVGTRWRRTSGHMVRSSK